MWVLQPESNWSGASDVWYHLKSTLRSLRGDGQFQPLTITQPPAQAGDTTAEPPAQASDTATPLTQTTTETQTDSAPTTTTASGPARPSGATTATESGPMQLTGPASTTKRDFHEPQSQDKPDKQPRLQPPATTLALSAPPTGDKRTTVDAGLTLDVLPPKAPKTRRVTTFSSHRRGDASLS